MSSRLMLTETHDDDGDGVGNNTDAFPQDGNETHDDDGDGVGNNTDAFPQDANETMDTDGDGVGDNADPAPKDPTISSPADLEVSVSDTSAYLIAGSIVFLALVIIFVRRSPPQCKPQASTQSMHIKNRYSTRIDVFNQSFNETTLIYFPFLNGNRTTGFALGQFTVNKTWLSKIADTKGKAVDLMYILQPLSTCFT